MWFKFCLLLACTNAFLARRWALLQRRTARSAATTTTETANATLLACAQAPDLFYLGDNETLYLRYLNSTRQLQNAKVEPKTIKAENKELISKLWRDRRMIVHDKAAYRKLVDGGDTATTQLSGGCRRAASIWDDNRGPDEASAVDYIKLVKPELLLNDRRPTRDDLLTLLRDFKERYPYYRGACGICGSDTEFVGEIKASQSEETAAKAGRVELRSCDCGHVTRFVRANDVGYALHSSRRGRCGEYSACFLSVLTALKLEARWVFDTTDHVWCEAKLGGEWVHLDPCEASLGEPEIYQGWGKNGTLVVAFSERRAEDVTACYYPSQKADVATRRLKDGLTDGALRAALAAYAKRGAGYDP